MKKMWIGILASLAVGPALLLPLWYRGGSEPSSAYVDISTGKPYRFAAQLLYRGIKVPGTSVVLFKRYYAIGEKDPWTGLTTSVAYQDEGYNQFFVFYEKGAVAAHGLCMVMKNNGQILHDIHDLEEGEFYNPDGQRVSSVKDGTGVQTFFFADGTKYWELHLRDFERRKLTIWNQDGSVKLEEEY